MRLSKGQFSTLSDICRETALVILGGFAIGNVLTPSINIVLAISGFLAYLFLAFLSIYFKKKGE